MSVNIKENGQLVKTAGLNSQTVIIDNLTTQDATKALSANQGYVLNQNKVDKVAGKGLSTNDYTNEDKTKLAGIGAGAEPNVQSDWKQSDSSSDDFIKNKPTSEIQTSDGQFTTVTGGLMQSCDIELEPIQDLHGYSKPWVGGSGKNLFPMTVNTIKTALGETGWTNNAKTISGVVFTILTDDGNNVTGIKLNGTASTTIIANLGYFSLNGTYRLLGCPTNGSSTTYRLDLRDENAGSVYGTDVGLGVTISTDSRKSICIRIENGYTCNNIIFKPMLASDLTVTYNDFEPYTNICPIEGHWWVTVDRVGKNKCNPDTFVQGLLNHSTGTVDPNGSWITSDFIPMSGTVTLSGYKDGTEANLCVRFSEYDVNKTFIKDTTNLSITDNATWNATITLNSNTRYVRATVGFNNKATTPSAYFATNRLQIEEGSQATDYEPYQGIEVITNLGGQKYGGKLDIISGVLTVTHAHVDLGSYTWNKTNANLFFTEYPRDFKKAVYASGFWYANGVCECYKFIQDSITSEDGVINLYFEEARSFYRMFVNDSSRYSLSASDFKTAVTGQYLVYELATPQTIQLTPTQLETLVGQNNVFAPLVGQTVESVEYREVLAIDDVPKAIPYENVAPDMGTGEDRTYFRIKKYGRLVQLEFIQSNYWMFVEQQTKVVFGVLPDGYYDKQPSSMLHPDVEFEYPFVNETATNQYDNRKLFINMVNGEVYSVYQANDVIHPMGSLTYILDHD